MRSKVFTAILALLPCLAHAQNATDTKPVIKDLPFQKWAPTPSMGWNSWDCFATTCTESQAKAHADYMAEKLKPYGWQYGYGTLMVMDNI